MKLVPFNSVFKAKFIGRESKVLASYHAVAEHFCVWTDVMAFFKWVSQTLMALCHRLGQLKRCHSIV